MLVNKQLGYKNNSNLANNVEIDKGYKQKKNYSLKSLFSMFSYEMFGCLFTLLNSDLKIWSAWFWYFICIPTQCKKPQGSISFNKKAHFFWLTRYIYIYTYIYVDMPPLQQYNFYSKYIGLLKSLKDMTER